MTPDDLAKLLARPGYAVVAESKLGARPVLPAPIAAEKPRIRQHKGDGRNSWEREYLQQLDLQWSHIHEQITLTLANGLTYKLDFLVVSTVGPVPVIEGHEVKGRPLPAGIAKLKMAARLYPWITFRLVTKRRKAQGGGWAIEEVLP